MGRKSVDLPTIDPRTPDGEEVNSNDDPVVSDAEQSEPENDQSSYPASTSTRVRPSALQIGAKHPIGAI
jgi:hypothetical protein